MKYLLDTNVISEVVGKQPNQAVLDWLDRLDPASVFISVITIGEIRKGIEKLPASQRRDQLSAWLEHDLLLRFHLRVAAITTEVMLTWGELIGRLEVAGRPMPAIDSLIAAIVLQGKYVLVTRNDEDFDRAGIPVVNPWKLLASG